MRIYPIILYALTPTYTSLSAEAIEYLWHELDSDNADGMRHVMRHLFLPSYLTFDEEGRELIKVALQWVINCADEYQYADLISEEPDLPFWAGEGEERAWFILWWESLFGDEDWHAPALCQQEVDHLGLEPLGKVPSHVYAARSGRAVISPEVVNFPRTDGLPPGHGAPPPERVLRQKTPRPTRPTDGARFFRWEDQATALGTAKEIHAVSGQLKVWVEFDWPVGEGYFVGGDVYRRTNWACVRFFDGKPVDSFPDLRKGWTQEEPVEEPS